MANEGAPIGNGPGDQPIRDAVARFLMAVPSVTRALHDALPSDVFRVVMSGDNAHLFKQGADGFYKPFLHDGRHFVENVNLAKVGPDYSRLAADLSQQVQMAAIMAKLDRIERAVEWARDEMRDERRNRVAGAVIALRIARDLSGMQERRNVMLGACSDAVAALQMLAGQLKSDIQAMPERSGFFEGFFSDPAEDAKKAFDAVKADVAAMAAGCRAVLHAYEDLDEPAAARSAFASFLHDVRAAGLPEAKRKARLVPGRKGEPAPEALVAEFGIAAENMHEHLVSTRAGRPLSIQMDFRPDELKAMA